MMKYIDSNIFLYPLLYEDNLSIKCKKILFDIVNGNFEGCTSFLTWDEVVYTLKKKRGLKIANEEGEKFLKFPNLKFLDVNLQTITKAQILMDKYNLNPRDAIHASHSILKSNGEIISLDKDFDEIKELKKSSLS